MTPYGAMIDAVSVHLPMCPRTAVLDALRQITIRFCRETELWTYPIADQVIPADDTMILLDLPIGSVISRVLEMSLDDERIDNYNLKPDGTITLFDPVNRDRTLRGYVVLMPDQQGMDCPDGVYLYWKDVIVAGAVAYLQGQPGREWSQPNMASMHWQLFESGLQQAISRVGSSIDTPQRTRRTKPHYF